MSIKLSENLQKPFATFVEDAVEGAVKTSGKAPHSTPLHKMMNRSTRYTATATQIPHAPQWCGTWSVEAAIGSFFGAPNFSTVH